MSLFSSLVDIGKVGLSIVPGIGNYLSAVDTNDTNAKLQKKANEDNVRLWQMQTEYNTPANQMKRLEAAGLNPNLAYGTVAESRMASAPMMEAAHMEAPKVPSLADYQQVINMQSQNQLQRAQIDQVAQQTALAKENLRYQKYENDTYMKAGAVKTDSPHVKEAGAVIRTAKSLWDGAKKAIKSMNSGAPTRDRTKLDNDVDAARARASRYLGKY